MLTVRDIVEKISTEEITKVTLYVDINEHEDVELVLDTEDVLLKFTYLDPDIMTNAVQMGGHLVL